MHSIAKLVSSALLMATVGHGQSTPASVVYPRDSRAVIQVPDDVKLLEEKTLPEDTLLSDKTRVASDYSSGSGIRLQNNSSGVGSRLFAFNLNPGETLKLGFSYFPLKDFTMLVSQYPGEHPMWKEIDRVNRISASLKRPNMEVKNITTAQQTITLTLSGIVGRAYKLTVDRKR